MSVWKKVICIILIGCGVVMTGCGGDGGGGAGTGLPSATGVRADSGPGFGQVTLSWTSVTGATSYNLYWSVTPGVTTASTKIAGVSSPYIQTINGRNFPSPLYYVVTAISAGGESGISTEVSATPSNVLN